MATTRVRSCWLATVATLILSTIAASPANATSTRRAAWRLEGYVGQAPAGIKPQARLVLQSGNKEYEFDLTKISVTSARASHSQLVRDVQPYQNKLLLMGPPASMDALTKAPAGQKLLIVGHYRTGSRQLQVTSISAAAADSTPTKH